MPSTMPITPGLTTFSQIAQAFQHEPAQKHLRSDAGGTNLHTHSNWPSGIGKQAAANRAAKHVYAYDCIKMAIDHEYGRGIGGAVLGQMNHLHSGSHRKVSVGDLAQIQARLGTIDRSLVRDAIDSEYGPHVGNAILSHMGISGGIVSPTQLTQINAQLNTIDTMLKMQYIAAGSDNVITTPSPEHDRVCVAFGNDTFRDGLTMTDITDSSHVRTENAHEDKVSNANKFVQFVGDPALAFELSKSVNQSISLSFAQVIQRGILPEFPGLQSAINTNNSFGIEKNGNDFSAVIGGTMTVMSMENPSEGPRTVNFTIRIPLTQTDKGITTSIPREQLQPQLTYNTQ